MNKTIARIISCFIISREERHKFIARHTHNMHKYGNKKVITGEETQSLIAEQLRTDKPCLICRFGSNEFETLYAYLNKKARYKKALKDRMYTGAGFFPVDDESLTKFAKELYDILQNIDILAAWRKPDEAKVCSKYCSENINYVNLDSLSAITYKNPWTKCLEGKKVLVIHPFEESLKKQYQRRELLFQNKETLPEFELITMKPVQSMADNKSEYPYKSWFEALEAMKEQIKTIDFDIAIIGAGAYGIFLGDYCKKLGKKAVHMGGATQILFGIAGKRWDLEYPNIRDNYYNEYWVRPSENEKPKGSAKVEGGCYW